MGMITVYVLLYPLLQHPQTNPAFQIRSNDTMILVAILNQHRRLN
jgi:hypothetical protein